MEMVSFIIQHSICSLRLHVAPVSCVTTALDNTIVISGSEDSSIIISSLETGKLVSGLNEQLELVFKMSAT